MATCKSALRAITALTAAIILVSLVTDASAQRFVEPGFRSHPLRSATPDSVEDSLRRFLSDRTAAGESVEIVSDQRARRLLVRGSEEVQRLADQFIQAVDIPSTDGPFAQAARAVRGYPGTSVEALTQRSKLLREHFAQRDDVRIAVDERTRQLVIHASEDVHQQIAANWNNPQFFQPAQPAQPAELHRVPPEDVPATNQNQPAANQQQQMRLQHITWQDLLRGLRGVQGQNAAVTSAQDGTLEMILASPTGNRAQLRIDQENQVIQISGTSEETRQWTRVVQALDQQPRGQGELQAMGRLGDAQPATITRTITMLGGQGAANAASRSLAQQNAQWGGEVVQRMFGPQREPLQMAQADVPGNAPATQQGSGEIARLLTADEGGGSFLGPVRIEFLEGTDIFIVRGQKRDVDRVMAIINDIERLTVDTEPAIEIIPLRHANSQALATLVNELNANVLQARQGDVSVTGLGKPNALLLIGRPAGVDSVKKIVEKLDVEAEPSDQFRVFKLDYLPSVDAERTINYLYNQQTQQTGATTQTNLAARVRAVADFRSNSIVVQGSTRDVDEIGELLNQIDVKGSATIAEVQVFPLRNAIAEEVAEVLNETLGTDQSQQAGQGQAGQGQAGGAGGNPNTQPRSSPRAMMLQMKVLDEQAKKLLDDQIIESGILSNIVVTFNERTNSVIVTAPKGSMDLIAEIIRQIDDLPSQEAFVRVFTVVNGDASTLIDMLDALFPQDDQDGPLVQSAAGTGESTLVPLRFALDPRTNSIIATGNEADLGVVEAIILKLDASDVSGRRTTVYELLNQEASAVADAITIYVQQRRDAITSIAPDTLSPYQLIDQEVIVVAEDNSNKVIISATDRYYEEVMQLIRDLDKRPDMVMVKCLIAEVQLNSTEEIGVELGIQDSLLFNRSVIGTDGVADPGFAFNNQPLGGNVTNPGSAVEKVAGQMLSSFGVGRTNSTLGYGGLVLSASNESVSVLIRALQESRRLDILSRPQVMMLNNTTGLVSVGARVPFIQDSINNGIQTTNSVTFEPVGLSLEVTPRISPDGLIVMSVAAVKSELGSIEDGIPISVSANGEVIRQPQINEISAQTIVSTREGQTVILGGLITKSRAAFERKVPYLGDVPFFGRLFRADGIAEQRQELLIILTPYIVKDESDINRVNSEEYARMSWCLGNVIETHGDIGPFGGNEEGVIYSDFGTGDGSVIDSMDGAPTDVQQIQRLPDGLPSNDVPTPAPMPGEAPLSLPQLSNPAVPNVPDSPPQAKKPSILLDAPRNAALDPAENKRLFGRLSLGNRGKASKVRPVNHEGDPQGGSAQSAIYRFDQIPINEQ